jgi:tRNA dimethylallyltransferase
MDIGTGKDYSEYVVDGKSVPCHLIDLIDPARIYTVYSYKKDFHRVFAEIVGRKRLPVLVGGTGLYIEAVLRNYSIPEVPEDAGLREELMARERQELEDELAQCAPDLHRSTDTKSKKRIVRSLEIAKHGKSAADRTQPQEESAVHPIVLGVVWDRKRLKDRIKERLHARFEQGMVEEVRRLLESGITRERLSMFGMEYKHIAGFLAGESDFKTMFAVLLHDIEQLSKRQSTYFRGMERRGVAMHWINEANLEEAEEVLNSYRFEFDG